MLYNPRWEDRPRHVRHYSLVAWDSKRWPNFTAKELSCPLTGELYYWPDFFDRLQFARRLIGKAFKINSAHRSYIHNLRVGGAASSQHLKIAVDISLEGHDRHKLKVALREAGFQGFGY